MLHLHFFFSPYSSTLAIAEADGLFEIFAAYPPPPAPTNYMTSSTTTEEGSKGGMSNVNSGQNYLTAHFLSATGSNMNLYYVLLGSLRDL